MEISYKKAIQRQKKMRYFIEATHYIIEEKGLENITIRDIANIAGYNSATIYNYFENLEHLVFFASLKYLKEYIEALNTCIEADTNSLDRYIMIWECFCHYSFNSPKIYNLIFFSNYSNSLNDDIEKYYSIFPEELGEHLKDIKFMLSGQNIFDRNKTILKSCVKEGFITAENLNELNEMVIYIYRGVLSTLLNINTNYSAEEYTQKTIKFIKKSILSFEGNTFEKEGCI